MSRSRFPSLVVASCLLAVAAAADPLGAKLSPPLPSGADVSSIQLSPDGSRVVFQVVNGASQELWSVPTAGGTPTRLHPPGGAGVASFARISPDGAWVAFAARFDALDLLDIYCAPIDGGALTLLAEDPADATRFAFSRDSSRVFFRSPEGLMSVPVSGGPPTLLAALGPDRYSTDFREQPDGGLLYVAVQDESDYCECGVGKELVRVPGEGGPQILLAAAPELDRGVGLVGGTPDGSTVVFARFQHYDVPRELYSVPAGGGPSTLLTLPLFLTFSRLAGWAVSPDGSRVLYSAPVGRSAVDLYSVLVEGGPSSRLNDSTSGVGVSWRLSPGWGRVVYLADSAFHSVPITGGPSVPLSPTLLSTPLSFYSPAISPDAHFVLYQGQVNAGVEELFTVPLFGGTVVKLNAPLPPGGQVGWALFTEDATRVVYVADQQTDGVQELWSVPSRGGAHTKLNPPLVAGGNVRYFLPTPDGLRVVYYADQEQDEVYELYASPLPPPPPVPSPRRCGLLGAEAVGLLAAFEALRARSLRRARGRSAQPRSAA